MAVKKKKSDESSSKWFAFAKVFETLADKFGWPGVVLVFSMYFVEAHATIEQKRAIIDMYVLGHGISSLHAFIVMGGLFIAVALAQGYWYKRKIRVMGAELTRIGGEKSEKQEKALGTPLHHSTLPGRSG